MESVGFKEWAVVCAALARGDQCVLIRKGGIAEGREGFSFRHREFFLFPTWFHEQPSKVKTDSPIPEQDPKMIAIDVFAVVESTSVVREWKTAEALEPLHILRSEVVRERFEYDEAPGVHMAFVRAYRIVSPWRFPNDKRFAGCRSWVDLPSPPDELESEPVLSDQRHQRNRRVFEKALSCNGAP